MSTLAFAILARVAREPITGYDLAKLGDVPFKNYWSASHSQIYPELARLEADGLVVAREQAGPGPRAKKVYSITEAGRQALREWAVGPIKGSPERDELAVRIDVAWLIGPEETARLLREERDRHAAKLAEYEALQDIFPSRPRADSPSFGAYLTLQLGLSYERHRVAWCDWCLAELGQV